MEGHQLRYRRPLLTYPGPDPGADDLDYFELKTGASYTFGDPFTLGITNYWSPNSSVETDDATLSSGRLSTPSPTSWWILHAQRQRLVRLRSGPTAVTDYTYWNAGLTLGFMDNWSADIRYWDTDLSAAACGGSTDNCDARVVGTISASF